MWVGMGIYKNVNPVYGKNDKDKRVYLGLKVDGVLHKGIRKISEIPVKKPKTIKKEKTKKKLFGRD